jgi:hypothetical protein
MKYSRWRIKYSRWRIKYSRWRNASFLTRNDAFRNIYTLHLKIRFSFHHRCSLKSPRRAVVSS